MAAAGGVFAVTPGLVEKHGPQRVIDTPISELALAGAAFGSAVAGLRPVVEIMFADFLPLVMDSLINQATKYWYLSNEKGTVADRDPLRVRRRGAVRRDPLADARLLAARRARPEDRVPGDSRRREGPAQVGDPRRQPGHLSRAQAAVRAKGEANGELVPIGRAASSGREPT